MAGLEKDDVYCELVHVSLDQQPAFEAISYVWGDPNNRREIECGTGILNITVSLYSALKALRGEKESRVIWTDAICKLTNKDMA